MTTTDTFLGRLVRGSATKNQARDTGMALVLALLLLALTRNTRVFTTAAIVVQIVNMTAPDLFRPLAVIWFEIAELLGTVASKVLLSVVFFAVVTPIGWWRRHFGSDSLRLREFGAGTQSVMEVRNHMFSSRDLERPY